MGKHSGTEPTNKTGVKDFVRGLGRTRKDGRHSTPATAAGVLQANSRKPVAAAIAVPTLAAAAVVGVGVGSQQGGSEAQVKTEAASADVKPLSEKDAGDEPSKQDKEAKKAAKGSAADAALETPAPKPKPKKTESSSSGSDSSSSSSSEKSSSGSDSSSSGSSSSPGGKKNSSSSGQGGSCQASNYGDGDGTDGGPTASGEKFDKNAMTAAHKSLPLNSHVKVTNKSNGKSVTVRINDRGPYVGGRCLDLSSGAFAKLGADGVATVSWKVL